MYTRGVPPAGVSIETLVEWLLIELSALETELAAINQELEVLKESQNAS